MTEQPLLLLVDGSSYLFRAYHALPPLTAPDGAPTGAVFGVAKMLKKLVDEERPAYLAVVFDSKGPTFRHERYAAYKANRPPMPDDLAAQIEPLHALVRAFGWPLLAQPGVEADDIIGTLARQGVAQGLRVLISTGDKDMAQLVEDGRISLVNTMSNTRLDEAGVREKYGVPPARIVDWLAIMGDSSDNIPGVPGAGPKTAAKWLEEFGSLDALMAHADEVKGKAGEKLRAALPQLPLSRELATIECAVPLAAGPRDLAPAMPDAAALAALLQRFGFKAAQFEMRQSTDQRVPGAEQAVAPAMPRTPAEAAPADAPAPEYDCVLDWAAFEAWLRQLEAAPAFAFDTETTGLDYFQARIVGVSFAVEPGRAAYVPLAHDGPGAPQQLLREAVLERLRPLLEDAARPKIGQHLKFDAHVLASHGITLRGWAYDTQLESYVLNSTAARHDMDSLAAHYLHRQTITYDQVAGKGARQIGFNQVGVAEAARYAAEDAEVTLALHHTLYPRLQAEPALLRVLEEIERPLAPVLWRMERAGVLLDESELRRQSQELGLKLIELERAAQTAAGQPFNIASPKQLQEILFEKLRLPVVKKTPGGQPSTAEDVLEELAQQHGLPRLVLQHRELAKLKSTYTDTLPGLISPVTGRVHTAYHQAVAATGRLSSSGPNLQNIPVRSEEGRRIRRAFIAPPGRLLLAADYSQIELRIMAHLSGDAGLLAAFAAGADVHRATAAEVFGAPLAQVTPEQRRAAKAINFGLIYGMSAFGLARQLGIERGAAQDYVNLYFARYPGVKRYMEATREQARERGYVETVFGRRLYLNDIRARNAALRQGAERAAINAPMQGTAADIIKRAMLVVDAWIEAQHPPLRLLMQVHDELVFEVDADWAEAARTEVAWRMQAAAELTVPLLVDTGIGPDWDAAH
jgi:DNA polymerase-1